MTAYKGTGLKNKKVQLISLKFELEDCLDCPECKQTVITYILETHSKTLSFYVEPHLDFSKIIMADAIKVERINQTKKHYDLAIYCPICGKPTIKYTGIPYDAKIEAGPEKQLVAIPLNEIPKDCIIAVKGIDVSSNPDSLEKWFRGFTHENAGY